MSRSMSHRCPCFTAIFPSLGNGGHQKAIKCDSEACHNSYELKGCEVLLVLGRKDNERQAEKCRPQDFEPCSWFGSFSRKGDCMATRVKDMIANDVCTYVWYGGTIAQGDSSASNQIQRYMLLV